MCFITQQMGALRQPGNTRILLTGHSLGGAMARLLLAAQIYLVRSQWGAPERCEQPGRPLRGLDTSRLPETLAAAGLTT